MSDNCGKRKGTGGLSIVRGKVEIDVRECGGGRIGRGRGLGSEEGKEGGMRLLGRVGKKGEKGRRETKSKVDAGAGRRERKRRGGRGGGGC